MEDKIQVSIRVRPLNQRERDENQESACSVLDGNSLCLTGGDKAFSFDQVFPEHTRTEDIYSSVAKKIIDSALAGVNGVNTPFSLC